MKSTYSLLIGLLLLLMTSSASAQEEHFSYTHFDKSDGLPSNTVYCMTTDKDGFLWISTDAGVSRFDGNKFVNYTVKDGLPSNEVFGIFCDSKNRLWFKTLSHKISYYYNGKIYNAENDTILSRVDQSEQILSIFEDIYNRIWIVRVHSEYHIIDGSRVSAGRIKEMGIYYVYKCLLMPNGIYFISYNATYFYHYSDGRVESFLNDRFVYITDMLIADSCYFADQDKSYLIEKADTTMLRKNYFRATFEMSKLFLLRRKLLGHILSNGLNLLDMSHPGKYTSLLKDYKVSYICNDLYDNIWISTLHNGIFKINSTSNFNTLQYHAPASNAIFSVISDQNKITAGDNSGRVYFISKKNFAVREVSLRKNIYTSNRISKLYYYNDSLFVCTNNTVFIYNTKTNTTSSIIDSNYSMKNLYRQNDTTILLTNVLIFYFDKNYREIKKYFTGLRVYSFVDYAGHKVFGTQDGLYEPVGDTMQKYELDKDFKYYVTDLQCKDSLLLASTSEYGLFVISKHKIIETINTEKGLSTNYCNKMCVYKNEIFIATKNGINIYNYDEKTNRVIYESDGLASNNVNDIHVFNDTIYAATDNGITILPIAEIKKRKAITFFFKPLIMGSDTIWDIPKSIQTRTSEKIRLTLNALSFECKGGVTYYYRIKELDTNFKMTVDQHIFFDFDNTGTYHFEAYAIDKNNTQSSLIELEFAVIPYYWQTNLFKFIVVLIVCTLIFFIISFFYRARIKKEIEKSRMLNKMNELELNAWKSNVNPHFVFNSLNTMQSLYNNEDFEKGNTFLANFSKILRKTIDHADKLLHPVSEEITYLKLYLDMEKIKRKNNFAYKIETGDEKINDYFIPTLLIQPVVENCLKHGIMNNKNGLIEIYFKLNEEGIGCDIMDNGPGFEHVNFPEIESNSKGIKLIREKIMLVEKIRQILVGFSFRNKVDKEGKISGAITTFTFPIIKSEYNND